MLMDLYGFSIIYLGYIITNQCKIILIISMNISFDLKLE